MLKTIADYLNYMNQLYAVAERNQLRYFLINTGSLIGAQQIVSHWHTPKNEDFSMSLVGNDGDDLIYVVKW